jgi:antagonist of KipI
MSVLVQRPGMLTTVQDEGRRGFQHYGVPVCGAMDAFSHRVANLLVGNDPGSATLEITLRGPHLTFDGDMLIALCGADLSPVIGNAPVPAGKPVWVRGGSELHFGACVYGCRAYLAVSGGFDVPPVMGSRSTYLAAGFGGYKGRALQKEDMLSTGAPALAAYPALKASLQASGWSIALPRWSVSRHEELLRRSPQVVRIVPGRHWSLFDAPARQALTGAEFRIGADSDRMGYRLDGPVIGRASRAEIVSEAVTFGTIQVPHDGRPIVLMADRQTVGGYPKIAEVASVDLPLMAQLKPGDRVSFHEISLAEAQSLYLKREQELAAIGTAIAKHINE